ncbi:hypothetical protein JXR93_07510 [bacterium]|nr:hypothetical protein [bacterium]
MLKNIILVLLSVLMFSCAQDMGTIDRTQPDRVDKAIFESESEWYMLQTVVDVPFSTGFTFIGEQGDSELVRWRITENYLYAHRSHDWVDGSEEYLFEEGKYYGAPIAIYKIKSHFDVQRQYNPSTGEETNVIEENESDRPWYERQYMRIDWSKNLVQDFRFGSPAQIPSNSVEYYVSENGEESKESPEVTSSYIGIVGMIFAEPETFEWDGNKYPSCYLFSGLHLDCLGQRIKIKTSFLKKDKTNDYQAVSYDDNKMAKFGYFRTERLKYDRWKGYSFNENINLINKWNVWEKGELSKAVADRKTRKIVYYLNDTFPEDLVEEAQKVICTWNRVFKTTVAIAKGINGDFSKERDVLNPCGEYLSEIDDILVLCSNNPVKEGDPAYCGKTGFNPQTGDLRYNFINWIANPQQSSPLGYGPTAKDSETGEIIQGVANVYGNELETYVTYILDLIDLLNGELTLDDYISGKYLTEYLEKVNDIPTSPNMNQVNLSKQIDRKIGKNYSAISNFLNKRDFSNVESFSSKMGRIKNTPLDSVLMTEPLKNQWRRYFANGDENIYNAEFDVNASTIINPDRFTKQRELEKILAEKTIMMSSFLDNSMLSWATRLKSLSRDKIIETIRKEVFFAVTVHEFGHTVGLRHNFFSAADATNFFNGYWDLKFEQADLNTDKKLQPEYIKAPTKEMFEAGLREYQYTSIMDYLMKPNSDLQGIGSYDVAVIHYGYGDQVQVFDGDNYNLDYYKAARSGDYHYTHLPYMLKTNFSNATSSSDIKTAMRTKKWITLPENRLGGACSVGTECSGETPICGNKGYCVQCKDNSDCSGSAPFCSDEGACISNLEVPFGFCSDEVVGDSWYCYRFSEGADFYEKMKAQSDDYNNFYFARNFKKGRALFALDLWSYISRVQMKFYYLTQQFKYSVYESMIKRTDPTFYTDPTRGQHFAVGQMESMNFFGSVLQSAEPGLYKMSENGTHYENIKTVLHYDDYEGSLASDEILVYPGKSSKYESDIFDGDLGYNYYYKPVVQGVLYDKIFALMFMGDPYFSPMGVDSQSEMKKYAINYYTIFPKETQQLLSSIYAEDFSAYAPYFEKNGSTLTFKSRPLVFLTEEDENEFNNSEKVLLDPDTQYTARLYAGYSIVGFFNVSWLATSFYDSARIAVKGSGDDYEPDWATLTEDVDYIQAVDPKTKRTYYALNYAQYEDPSAPDYNLGWRMIEQVKAKMNDLGNDPSNSDWWEVDSKFESMDVIRAFYYYYKDNF